MKRICVVLGLLLASAFPSVPATGQAGQSPSVQSLLEQWADAETVQNWGTAILAGQTALKAGRVAEAAASFRKAIDICEPKSAKDIHPCIARLLLAEAVLADGFNNEALAQTDQLVARLKQATRYTEFREIGGRAMRKKEVAVNSYKYQVGAALYMRAARMYLRLNQPKRAAPLFTLATKIFKQFVFEYSDLDGEDYARESYSLMEYRVAEIHDAEGRFLVIIGDDRGALESFQMAETCKKSLARKYASLPQGILIQVREVFLDQLVAEPLDKSLLKRFLEDCAFYQFDDARIADLLDRQAALLRKVSRNDEATAFERFAESLRKRPATP